MGNFDVAMAYGIILMAIVLAMTLTINLVEKLRHEEMHWELTFGVFGKKLNQDKS